MFCEATMFDSMFWRPGQVLSVKMFALTSCSPEPSAPSPPILTPLFSVFISSKRLSKVLNVGE